MATNIWASAAALAGVSEPKKAHFHQDEPATSHQQVVV